jgi:hypothetical protein
MLSEIAIHRALDSPAATIEDVGIDHRGLHAAVPQELLDRPDVITAHEEMGREGMTERMAGRMLGIPALRAAPWKARWIVLSWR